MSKNYERKSPEQIIRLDGKNVFLEVMNSAFEISKVLINFQEYDATKEKGNRIKQEISIYFDLDKFLVLSNDLLTGRLSSLAKKAKEEQEKGGYKYCKEIYMDQGGTSAARLEQKGKSRPDGKSEARMLKITPGEKIPWMISAELGPGEESETGLIMPKFVNNRPEKQIRVPVSNEDFKRLVLIVTKHIEAFLASKYVRNEFTYKKDEQPNQM
ncbi:hypothetical protein [Paenibacillus polymyxa]|uniref:Uncharacterized protein n=1 Tax=Paenibacillus polymyxa (strain SC2) TaxID=886882 RepID=E3EKB1_PAEPS|nr:hypothetical protein [Paenibacillus polymyxa]ADO59438.1 hypothetical protein PPSC2_27870 [Paenibacillus polymyxa SC2]WPQ59722.1 hypothetical protein SKN87_29110 [Paenibacillus polymyxa]